jgi:hypothetical protein
MGTVGPMPTISDLPALFCSVSLGSRRLGMNTVAREYPRIVSVEVTDRSITAVFSDGRQISLPLSWSWRLERAAPAQRTRWELVGDGEGVRWPEIDEDLSARGFFEGKPAPRPRARSS